MSSGTLTKTLQRSQDSVSSTSSHSYSPWRRPSSFVGGPLQAWEVPPVSLAERLGTRRKQSLDEVSLRREMLGGGLTGSGALECISTDPPLVCGSVLCGSEGELGMRADFAQGAQQHSMILSKLLMKKSLDELSIGSSDMEMSHLDTTGAGDLGFGLSRRRTLMDLSLTCTSFKEEEVGSKSCEDVYSKSYGGEGGKQMESLFNRRMRSADELLEEEAPAPGSLHRRPTITDLHIAMIDTFRDGSNSPPGTMEHVGIEPDVVRQLVQTPEADILQVLMLHTDCQILKQLSQEGDCKDGVEEDSLDDGHAANTPALASPGTSSSILPTANGTGSQAVSPQSIPRTPCTASTGSPRGTKLTRHSTSSLRRSVKRRTMLSHELYEKVNAVITPNHRNSHFNFPTPRSRTGSNQFSYDPIYGHPRSRTGSNQSSYDPISGHMRSVTSSTQSSCDPIFGHPPSRTGSNQFNHNPTSGHPRSRTGSNQSNYEQLKHPRSRTSSNESSHDPVLGHSPSRTGSNQFNHDPISGNPRSRTGSNQSSYDPIFRHPRSRTGSNQSNYDPKSGRPRSRTSSNQFSLDPKAGICRSRPGSSNSNNNQFNTDNIKSTHPRTPLYLAANTGGGLTSDGLVLNRSPTPLGDSSGAPSSSSWKSRCETPLEHKIGRILRAKGDSMADDISCYFRPVVTEILRDATYGRFSEVMQERLGGEPGWRQVAALVNVARSAVEWAGYGTAAARRVKESTLRYFEDHLAGWVLEQGGWQSMLGGDDAGHSEEEEEENDDDS